MALVSSRFYARCRLAQIESKYIFQLTIQDVMLISLISGINKIEEEYELDNATVQQDSVLKKTLSNIYKTEFNTLKKLSMQINEKRAFSEIYQAYEKMTSECVRLLRNNINNNVIEINFLNKEASDLYELIKDSKRKFICTFKKEGTYFLKNH